MLVCACVLLAVLGMPGCATSKSPSEREWAKAECRNVIDSEARTKCLERVDKE
jgi:hypothetical protein